MFWLISVRMLYVFLYCGTVLCSVQCAYIQPWKHINSDGWQVQCKMNLCRKCGLLVGKPVFVTKSLNQRHTFKWKKTYAHALDFSIIILRQLVNYSKIKVINFWIVNTQKSIRNHSFYLHFWFKTRRKNGNVELICNKEIIAIRSLLFSSKSFHII